MRIRIEAQPEWNNKWEGKEEEGEEGEGVAHLNHKLHADIVAPGRVLLPR